ncbi:uncharacterized protein [Branchiostoma lanceolatum]|uniref:uncharacterized protein isoform X1 n=1 Tax=Branchiostoma lanceolatum TaxID=7740 RepID=UPI003451D33E
MKTRLSEDGTKLVATYELHPFDFDRSGHLKLWILARMLVLRPQEVLILLGAKAQLRNPGRLKAIAKLLKTCNVFLRYREFRIQPEFYTKLRPGADTTTTVTLWISHVGKTSWLLEGDVRLASTGEVLCHCVGQAVLMNTATRKPTGIPEFIREAFPQKNPLPRLDVPMPLNPGRIYRHDLVALPSDSDINEHTNFSTYIRFCTDATAALVREGAFPFLNEEVKVKKISLLFQKETREGENVTVEAAEDSGRSHSLDFQVKRGNDGIVKCCFEFFDDDIKSKL